VAENKKQKPATGRYGRRIYRHKRAQEGTERINGRNERTHGGEKKTKKAPRGVREGGPTIGVSDTEKTEKQKKRSLNSQTS